MGYFLTLIIAILLGWSTQNIATSTTTNPFTTKAGAHTATIGQCSGTVVISDM